ncbi:hypothetical protein D9M68_335590 [compost metagenome]
MVTRVRPRSSCQNACSTSAGVPLLPLRTGWLVGGGRHAVAEEQQAAHLTVQRTD